MGSGWVTQAESGSQITLQVLNFLDVLHDFGIDCFLNSFQFTSPLLLGFLSFFRFLDSHFRGILEFVLGISSSFFEEGIIDIGVNSIKGNFSWGGDDVGRVNSSKGNSIDSIGSSDENVAWRKVFEDNDSSSSVDSWKEDNNGSRLNGFSTFVRFGLFACSFETFLLVISWIPGIIFISESSLGGSSESYIAKTILRCEVDGLLFPLVPTILMGVAR